MLLKFFIATLIAAALPLASLLYTNGFKAQKDLEQKVNRDLSQTTDLLASKIDVWNDMNLRLLKQNAGLAQMASGEESQQKPILESLVDTYEWLYLAYAIGSDGYKTARSDDKAILKADGTKAHYRGDRTYYRHIQAGSTIGQQVVLSRTLNKPAFILCRALALTNFSLKDKGALCVGSTVSELSDTVVNTRIGKTGYAILLDDSNKVIAHGKAGAIKEQLQDFSAELVVTKSRPERPYTYQEGDTKKIAYMKFVAQGWRLIVTQDYNDAYAEYLKARRDSIILLLVTILVSGLIAYFMAKFLSMPIKNLTAIANDISKGRFHNSIEESKRSDELGELSRAIEKMSTSIAIAIRKLKARKQ